jgi:hypothetical protein
MWKYEGKEFTSEMIGDAVGFVYCIYDNDTRKKYIGKKKFWSKVTKPPLKGKTRKRKSVKESDWQDYHGSNEELKLLVEENTNPRRFYREILRLCYSLGEMSYYEMREQLMRDVLLKPDEYHNSFVGGKIHRKHLSNLIKKPLDKN